VRPALVDGCDPAIPVVLDKDMAVEVSLVIGVPTFLETEGASNKIALAFRVVGCHDD